MIYLRVLGGLTLEEDGETLRGRAVQKRRLALLSVLAVAPLRSASRDRLLGLLWPRKEEEKARHLLSAAIHEIRKELDEGMLVSRGDDLVLDAAVIATDLEEFRSAMEQGDLDRAVALYSGPFLDGFILGGSPAFDQWMESERAAISRNFRGALERLAERHEEEGRPEEAVATWRRLAAEDRYNSRIAIRLLSALEAVGNRGGALEFARVHEVLLREEFETAPPPEFTALVAAMRNLAEIAGPPDPASVPEPSEPAKQVEPPSQAVFQMQDDIATSVLRALPFSLELGGIRPLVGETRDEVAYGYYLRGRHAWYRRTPDGFRQALTYFQSAVEQDNAYARAYAGLADTYNLLGAYDYGLMPPDSAFPRARVAAERALELAPNLADAHAALAQTLFSYDRDWAGSEASFLTALRLNPRSVEAHHWYSLLLIAIGRGEEALEAAEQAVLLDSVSPITHANMGRHLYYRGDYEAAESAFRRALALDPGAITAHLGHGLVLMELGRANEAAAIFARVLEAAGQPHPVTLALLGHALGRADRPDEACETLVRLEGLRDVGTYVPSEYPALIHIAIGNLDRAVAGFEAAFEARSSASAFMGVDPLATPLRAHPGFQRLLAQAGLSGGEQ